MLSIDLTSDTEVSSMGWYDVHVAQSCGRWWYGYLGHMATWSLFFGWKIDRSSNLINVQNLGSKSIIFKNLGSFLTKLQARGSKIAFTPLCYYLYTLKYYDKNIPITVFPKIYLYHHGVPRVAICAFLRNVDYNKLTARESEVWITFTSNG